MIPSWGIVIALAALVVAEETPWYAARLNEGQRGLRLVRSIVGRYAWILVLAAYMVWGDKIE